jgi:hypothetical protein
LQGPIDSGLLLEKVRTLRTKPRLEKKKKETEAEAVQALNKQRRFNLRLQQFKKEYLRLECHRRDRSRITI